MKQIKAELYKLSHTKAVWLACAAYGILLLVYANADSLLLMVAGNLADPNNSVGFFRGTLGNGEGTPALWVMRSAHSFLIFSWLICANLCISVFSAEVKNRTAMLYVCHGGRLTVLYGVKFCVTAFLCAAAQMLFTLSCLFIACIQLRYPLTAADLWGTILVAALNILVLVGFLSLAVFVLLLTQSRLITELAVCLLPLVGVFLYQVNFTGYEALAAPLKLIIQMLPTYYWSNFCALRLLPGIQASAVCYAAVTLLFTSTAARAVLKRREIR